MSLLHSLPGSDYLTTAGFVEFGPGEVSQVVTVSIVEDTVLEDLEMFSATLMSTETNVVVEVASSRADITIVDDDREYLFSFFPNSKH